MALLIPTIGKVVQKIKASIKFLEQLLEGNYWHGKTNTNTIEQKIFRNYPANIRLDEDVLKTSWRRLSSSCSEDAFKTSSRRLDQDEYLHLSLTSSRHLQDVFKTYYQVKVFLVTQFQDIFETYSKRFWDVLLRRLSTGGLPMSHFREIYGHCAKFPRVIKISQVVIFHFTTPFSGYTLQWRI